MYDDFESNITFEIPKDNINFDKLTMSHNYTFLLTSLDEIRLRDSHEKLSRHILNTNGDEHNRFIGDIWIGCILIFLIVLSIFCASSYYLYYKFRQWKNKYINRRLSTESYQTESSNIDIESLPNYTLVSGLPSYEDAIEQLKNYRYYNKSTLPTLYYEEHECTNCGEYYTTTASTIIHPSKPSYNEPSYCVINMNDKNQNINNTIATTVATSSSSSSENIPSYDDAVNNLLNTHKPYTQENNKEYIPVPSYEVATSSITTTPAVVPAKETATDQQSALHNEIDNNIENSNS